MAKIGPHVILPSSDALEFARHAPIVKSFSGAGQHMQVLKAAQPGAILVHRPWLGNNAPLSPTAVVSRIVQDLGGFRHPNLYVELWNEQNQDLFNGLREHLAAVRAATVLLHAEGIKVAGFSFSVGNPTEIVHLQDGDQSPPWDFLRAEGYGGVDAVALHEYWPCSGNFSTWTALRYRRVHEWTDGDHPAFIITECGVDAVEGGPSGWKLCGAAVAPIHMLGAHGEPLPYKDTLFEGWLAGRPEPVPLESLHWVQALAPITYLQQLARYAAEIAQDDYVLGATPFTSGPTSDWERFSIDGLDMRQFYGLPPRTAWRSAESIGGDNVTIEELAEKPQRDDPEHVYGLWSPISGTGGIRIAIANTPEWQFLVETMGPAGPEAVVIDSQGLYRPN